jgi:hypothetical protein
MWEREIEREREREREREWEMTLTNVMPSRPGLLWVTLDLALIIQCLSRFSFNFTYPVRCFRVRYAYHRLKIAVAYNIRYCACRYGTASLLTCMKAFFRKLTRLSSKADVEVDRCRQERFPRCSFHGYAHVWMKGHCLSVTFSCDDTCEDARWRGTR